MTALVVFGVAVAVVAGLLLSAMCLISMSLKLTVEPSSGSSISKTTAYSADSQIQVDLAVANGGTNIEHVVAFDKDSLQAIYLVSDQNVTLKTNSSGSPADTISLLANVPFIWADDGYIAVPFSADVTKFYWTNASGTTANIQGKILWDATP